MAIEIVSTYLGDLDVENIHTPSKAKIVTTPPPDNQGRGDLFSPTDLFATSLSSCMLSVMAIYAQNKNIDFKGARVSVVKEMLANPRRVGKLTCRFYLSAAYDEELRKKFEAAAKQCPIKNSLHPDIDIVMEFNYE